MLILCCAEISYALFLFLYFRLARLFRLSSVLNCANLKINEVWKKQYNILNPRTILVDTQKGAQPFVEWAGSEYRAYAALSNFSLLLAGWLPAWRKALSAAIDLYTCWMTVKVALATEHTRTLATRHVLRRRCDSMTFCARASFETFLASSRITHCAKKRLLCQGQRQDSPQVARASDASRRTMGAKLSSSATQQPGNSIWAQFNAQRALCQTQLKYIVYI